MGHAINGRIYDPIIFLFTKYDQLPIEKQTSPAELIKELPEITGALHKYHNGDISYFKSFVESKVLSENEINKAITEKQSQKNKDLIDATNKIEHLESAKKNAQKELARDDEIVSQLQNRLAKNKESSEITTDDLKYAKNEQMISKKKLVEITTQLDTAKRRLADIKDRLKIDPPSTAEELGISKYRPNKPLKYSIVDYLQIIDWIIKIHQKSMTLGN